MTNEIKALRRALLEATISLKAIGEPRPNDAPDAHICGVIARSALVRIDNALDGFNKVVLPKA